MRSLVFFFSICCTISTSIAAKSLDVKRWQTSHGAHVVFYPTMEIPMLTISIAFAGGSAYDGKTFGLSALTTRLLNQGNNGLDATAIAEKLADTGAQYDSQSDRDMTVLHLKTLTTPSAMNAAVELFGTIVGHPDFPMASFAREKNQQLMAIAQAEESPDEVANQAFFKALYQTHPYAHPIIGTRDQVTALTIEQVRDFYHQYFVSRNATIVMVGAIDQPTAKRLSEQLTRDLPEGKHAADIPKAKPLPEAVDIGIPYPSSQTVLVLGQLGIDHHNPYYFPYVVGNYSLGGGSLVSRLALEVRAKRGLTYGVYSTFDPMPGLGPFLISLSTQNNQATTALQITRDTLSTFIKTGASEQELAAAKKYLVGSFPLSLASNGSIAGILLKIAFYHLPENYLETYLDNIKAVTAPQIKQAFQTLILPEKLLQVRVGTP